MTMNQLLAGRKIVDDYKKLVRRYGRLPYLIKKVNSKLKSIGFDTKSDFYSFNLTMNLQEVDRCVRFRRLDNELPALCDNCTGRSVKPCTLCDMSLPENNLLNYTPNSEMVAEQKTVGTADFYVVPICYYYNLNLNDTMPGYCIGKQYRIKPFQFDVEWGMKNYIDFGINILKAMNKANNK